MNEKKALSLHARLIIGYVSAEIGLILILIFGQTAIKKIAASDNPEFYVQHYNIGIAILFIIQLIVMIYNSVMIPRSLRKSMETISNATKKIAEGDINVDLKKYKNDEFGRLIDEYKEVVDSTRYLADVADKVAEGDMTVQVSPRSGADVLGNAIKTLVEKNNRALTNVSDAAHQVMTSSSQVASASESLAQGSTEQASAIQEITASITEIAQKTKQNALQASEASDLMESSLEDVKRGNGEMKDMVVAMEEINNSSESISKIIKVIDDIAFQTNILALNAAVEAARAGEAGKGFAVVAEEVRNLAAKSAAAAAETAELIEDSMRKVAAGSKIAANTSKALAEITVGVEKSESMIREIAEASNYQATAVAQVNQAIGQVSQVVQTNSATSEECAAAAEELSNQSIRMREMLSVYRLDSGSGSSAVEAAMGQTYVSGASSIKPAKDTEKYNEQIISLGEDFGKY